nr:hypothetical protein [uncultured Duganella sp.]
MAVSLIGGERLSIDKILLMALSRRMGYIFIPYAGAIKRVIFD